MRFQTYSSPPLGEGKSWLAGAEQITTSDGWLTKCEYSRTGGAMMKMPPANFSSAGLARLFGAGPDDKPETPPHAAHSETVVILGVLCGLVSVALLVAVGWYAATRIHHESEQQHHEIQGVNLTRIHHLSEQPHHDIPGVNAGGHVRGGAVEPPVELQAHSASE